MVESEMEWLFHTLWNKNTVQAPEFTFSIPQTVIFKNGGEPKEWYFTSKDGRLKKKKNVTL